MYFYFEIWQFRVWVYIIFFENDACFLAPAGTSVKLIASLRAKLSESVHLPSAVG